MKKILLIQVLFLLISVPVISQRPWQDISNPSINDVYAVFPAPPAEYGMVLWWGWDGRMSDTVIKRDPDRIKACSLLSELSRGKRNYLKNNMSVGKDE